MASEGYQGLRQGTLIAGKYSVVRPLGEGAMGAVYEAEHIKTRRRVALKVIQAHSAGSQGLVARFQNEARAAGQLRTPHIVEVIDTDHDSALGLPFMVMELLDGEDVEHLIGRLGCLHPQLALRIVAQACVGLEKAREGSIIHRDIKPANLFLSRQDGGERIVKVVDFGIAKIKLEQAQETQGAGLTKTGSMLGSPMFMSPEQARGRRDIDHRTDIWSLGVVLYQASCGTAPFGDATALGDLLFSICSLDPQPLSVRAPWIPPSVAAIAHKAMRRDPGERFQTAAEMREAIVALLPGRGAAITDDMLVPLEPGRRDWPLAASVPAGKGGVGGVPRLLVLAGGLLGVGGAGAGLFLATRSDTPEGGSAPAADVSASPAEVTSVSSAQGETRSAPEVQDMPKAVSFKLTVIPTYASVLVDGQQTPMSNGTISLIGRVGDVKVVRVSSKEKTTEVSVKITELGLNPPKIELWAPPATSSGAPPVAGTSAPWTPPSATTFRTN